MLIHDFDTKTYLNHAKGESKDARQTPVIASSQLSKVAQLHQTLLTCLFDSSNR